MEPLPRAGKPFVAVVMNTIPKAKRSPPKMLKNR
jgi:hypothetical protein